MHVMTKGLAWFFVAALFWASTALAGDQTAVTTSQKQALIAQIETAGRNETDQRRHSVAVQDCTMKTQLWQNQPDQGWVLWSSFTVSMPDVRFEENTSADGVSRKFLSITAPAGSDSPDLVVIPFKMRKDTSALYERSSLRKPLKDSWPSSRNDGTTHRFSRSGSFLIIHEGADVIAKAEAFVSSFETYVLYHCIFTG